LIIQWLQGFLSNINLATWLWLFISYFVLNVLYTKNALYTYKLNSTASANTGVLIYILGYIGMAEFIKVPNNILPILAASWLGEYFTIEWEKKVMKRIADEELKAIKFRKRRKKKVPVRHNKA
jgi:hypothetical protein